jgi:sugar phosphate isomerase/epimerase
MTQFSRRQFIGSAAALTAARLSAAPLGQPIGVQTWIFREEIGKDFDGTLKKVAAEGYQSIEMCSPPGYKDTGFGPLIGMKASDMRRRIQAAGLQCVSSHYGFSELKDHFDERAAYAKELGLTQMIISSFGLPENARMSDWVKAATDSNRLGERAQRAGLQLGFHNHHGEFEKLDGVLIYDELLRVLDPKLVKMQFQVGVVSIGYHAADYFEKHPGRFISMHLQDWSAATKQDAPVGKGAVDWKRTFAAAKKAGVKNYFLEMEADMMRASLPYVRSLS